MRKSIQIIFRQTSGNKFTIPLLLNLLEKENLDQWISIWIVTSHSEMLKACHSSGFTIAVFSFMTPQLPEVWNEIQNLRLHFSSRLFLLAGGPHPSGAPEETLVMGFDCVFIGPGESDFSDLIKKILDDPDAMQGKVIHGKPVLSLDDSFPVSRNIPFIPPPEIMRGCFYHCTYCQTGHNQKPVFRSFDSIQQILNEWIRRDLLNRTGFICPSGLEYMAKRPGHPNLDQIGQLLSMTKYTGIRHLEYGIFPSEIHPKTLTTEALQLIRKYCSNKKLTLGAQSGSNVILKRIKRGHTIEHIESAAALAHEQGFRVILDFILGFPDETDEDRLKTLEWIKTLNTKYKARIQMHYFIPLAGTSLENRLPTLPGQKIHNELDHLCKAGICTSWWRTGMKTSWTLIETRKKLNLRATNFGNQK